MEVICSVKYPRPGQVTMVVGLATPPTSARDSVLAQGVQNEVTLPRLIIF